MPIICVQSGAMPWQHSGRSAWLAGSAQANEGAVVQATRNTIISHVHFLNQFIAELPCSYCKHFLAEVISAVTEIT